MKKELCYLGLILVLLLAAPPIVAMAQDAALPLAEEETPTPEPSPTLTPAAPEEMNPPSSGLDAGVPLTGTAPGVMAATASCPPTGCTPGKNVGRDYFVQVVERLKDVPTSGFAVDALAAWEPHENTNACWNPLATTWKMEVVCDFNSVGVQHYQNQDMGVRATANTLNLSYYNAIRKMLRREAFDREGMRAALGTWGTCSGSGCDSLLNKWQNLWNGHSEGWIAVDSAWTTDGGWSSRKTSFKPGDSIRYVGAINNQTGGSATAHFVWDVIGPGGRIAGWSGNLNTGAGVKWWGLPDRIPSNARPGSYAYSLKVTYNGQTSSRSTTFTVAGGSSCPNQYRAEYYNNRSLSGNPTFTRCEGWPISHDWGGGGPGHGVGNDNFSARWTGKASISAGSYTFIARSDDGIRVWLDNSLIIDKWFDQGPTEYRVTRYVNGGEHNVRVEYYEHGGGAVAQFRWERANASCPTITHWKGEYWNNQGLSGNPVLCRNDANVNFDWGSGGPGGGVPSEHFSARWTRTMHFDAGRYRFHLRGDDGVRLWVDGNRIIDGWRDQAATDYTAERVLSAGNHSLKVEYYENGGEAIVKLWWESVGGNSNLALGRPTWATSQESSSYTSSRGNDGNRGTRWSSRISSTLGDEWWRVDLGNRRAFNRVFVRWETAYAAEHFVGWSNDGWHFYGYWFTISRPGAYSYSIGNRNARYVAVLMRRRAPRMNNYSFWEFEVYQNARAATSQDQAGETSVVEVTPTGDLVTISSPNTEKCIFLPLVSR